MPAKTVFGRHVSHHLTKLVLGVTFRSNDCHTPNSTNGFIFYGKGAELATNRQENQEIGLLGLHLLQTSLVYVNTLMIQQVLVDPARYEQMTNRDLSALSPLLTQHINPYGRFELDMETRLNIETAAAA